jgi:hypothetical protein
LPNKIGKSASDGLLVGEGAPIGLVLMRAVAIKLQFAEEVVSALAGGDS